jgi:hypothetical protein
MLQGLADEDSEEAVRGDASCEPRPSAHSESSGFNPSLNYSFLSLPSSRWSASVIDQAPDTQPPLPEESTRCTHQITPQTTTCQYCGNTFSPQRLIAHQKPKNRGGPAPCTQRFPCTLPGEPGCNETFKHKRDRLRHREHVCKHTGSPAGPALGFRCRCSKIIKRWYQFKRHHDRCSAARTSNALYKCQCGRTFDTMAALEEHHKTEMGKAGRPRKPQSTQIE